jgi:hypothetical protein
MTYRMMTVEQVDAHIQDPKNTACDVVWSEFSSRFACHTHELTVGI